MTRRERTNKTPQLDIPRFLKIPSNWNNPQSDLTGAQTHSIFHPERVDPFANLIQTIYELADCTQKGKATYLKELQKIINNHPEALNKTGRVTEEDGRTTYTTTALQFAKRHKVTDAVNIIKKKMEAALVENTTVNSSFRR